MRETSWSGPSILCLALVAGALALPAMAEPITVEALSVDEAGGGSLPVVSDITDTEAVILFRSSVPLACSVVYGDSPAFGRIAVDDDMDGSAHSDHHPILSGLRPDTEYFFRVQGTGADGTLYLGPVQNFRTLAAVAAPRDLAKLSEGAQVVAVSSNYGGAPNEGAWGANGAIDGSRGTAWSSNGDGDAAFIEIALGERAEIGAVEVWSRSMSDGTARITRFTLTDDAGKVHGPFDLPGADRPYRFALQAETATLRLDVIDSSGGNTGLIELSVFAE